MNVVARYCSEYERSGTDPLTFARRMLARDWDFCLRVMEEIGSWPSSEPELRALQKVFA